MHLFPYFFFHVRNLVRKFQVNNSLFFNAASNSTSLSKLSKFLLLLWLFSGLDILLLLNFVQVLFLFTVDRRTTTTIWRHFVYRIELWKTGYMVSIEVNYEPSIKGQLTNQPFNEPSYNTFKYINSFFHH